MGFIKGNITLRSFLIILVIVSLTYVFIDYHSTAASSDSIFIIDAPLTATEEEYVNITVTLDGVPVQARIIFDGYSPLYTNGSTGSVTLQMPSVPPPGSWFNITASYSDGYHSTHQIYVKSKIKTLTVTLSKESVREFDQFLVTVSSDQGLVEGAHVQFNYNTSVTDESGQVTLKAPDVLITTNYYIVVNKTGYKTTVKTIMVYNAGLGDELMEVSAPLFIRDTDTIITIRVYYKNGGLPDANAAVLYRDKEYTRTRTNSLGVARLPVPVLSKGDNSFLLKVEKDGYRVHNDESLFQVYVIKSYDNHSLRLNTLMDEVNRGSSLIVRVTDEHGDNVEDAIIWRNDGVEAGRTDSNGSARVIIPYVFFSRELTLYATKPGYNFASKSITVKTNGVSPALNIILNNSVINEDEVFNIMITDQYEKPVNDALVVFNMLEKRSDENGEVYFTAPSVDQDMLYVLSVFKDGYQSGSTLIMVINTTSSLDAFKFLSINTPVYVWEKTDFIVTVKDRYGYPVKDAMVSFHGLNRLTDTRGIVVFTAPAVVWDTLLRIRVEKNSYNPSSVSILIRSRFNYPYFYLVVVVSVIMLIGVVYYIKYNKK